MISYSSVVTILVFEVVLMNKTVMWVLMAALLAAFTSAYSGGIYRDGPYGSALVIRVPVSAYPYTGPVLPITDPTVRVGGPFPSASYYVTGLRAGIVTHPFCGYECRVSLSSAYYPRQYMAGIYGSRDYYYNYRAARIGGRFNTAPYFRGITGGGFVYSGSRMGGATVLPRY